MLSFVRYLLTLALMAALWPAPVSAKAVVPRRPPPRVQPLPEPEPEPEPEPAARELDLDESSVRGRIRLSNQYVDRSERRLVAQADGTVPTLKVSENGYFASMHADLAAVVEKTLSDDWMIKVENQLRADLFDPERVNSERYDFLDNRLRADLGTLLGESRLTLLDIGVFWDEHKEGFDPNFRARSTGADVSLDRELSKYRNLTGTFEARRTTFDGLAIEDHDQLRASVSFFRYWPETLDLEVLPYPMEEEKRRPDSFEYAKDLQLGRSRKQMLDLGAGRIAHSSREPEAVPLHRRQFKDHVGRREAGFGATAAYARREADIGGAGSFHRGTALVWGRRAPTDNTLWTLEDQFDATDRDAEDAARFLYDQLDNRVSLERARVAIDSSDQTKGSLEMSAMTDHNELNTARLVLDHLSWRHFGRRYAITTWFRGFKRLNDTPALDYQEREGFRSKNTFTMEYGPESALDLSLAYERTAVQGLQTEFDSTYAQVTWELRYRRKLAARTSAEMGYRTESERHQANFQNNRDEQIVFLDLVADL